MKVCARTVCWGGATANVTRLRLGALSLILAAAVLGACGDEPEPASIELPGEPAPESTVPLEVNSTAGCAVDADCASGRFCFQSQCVFECSDERACSGDAECSPRGRCTADGTDVAATLPADLSATNTPQTVFHVAAGQQEVTFTLELNQPAPAEGLQYRIERGFEAEGAEELLRTSGGQDVVDIVIPTGKADPEHDDSQQVRLKLFTPVGNYQLALVPEYPIGGNYVGEAYVDTFGPTGLPLELQIVTQPDGATLADADKAWLVLPVGPQHLFSPLASANGQIEYVARELVYDDFVEQWVARFSFAFEVADAGSGDVGIIRADSGQVRRALRFQLEPGADQTVIGEFSDTWTGLYETLSANGVRTLEDVQFSGDLYLQRYSEGPSNADISVGDHPEADPQPLDAPPLEACTDAIFAVATECDSELDGVAAFESAAPAVQASCAVAVAEHAISGETTSQQIQNYLDGDATNDAGQSFAEFMEECAAGTNGTCRPSDEVLCARQLTAHAYRNQPNDAASNATLVSRFEELTLEAYLGRELGAFGTDSKLRLEWLETTDYPAVVASAVEDLNRQLLEDWKTKVLDAHMGVLSGQLDASGLAVLSRQTTGASSADAREQLLVQMTQSWRGTLDSLTMATTRWHELLKTDADRAAKRDLVSARIFDLYLAAGILKNLNLAADAGYLSGRLAGGMSILLRELHKLSLPFDELIYARDAEVVVNTSIDPLSGNDTLLSERETEARAELERAHESVTGVIERAQAEALDETQLRNRMANEIGDLRASLVELCGLPSGCTVSDMRTDEACRVQVEVGQCGFALEKGTGEYTNFAAGQQSISEAGQSLLDVMEAANNIGIADEELRALVQRTSMEYAELQTFAAKIQEWNDKRLGGAEALAQNIQDRQDVRSQAVSDILDNMEQRAATHQEAIESTGETFDKWNEIRMGGVTRSMGLMLTAHTARSAAAGLEHTAESIDSIADAIAAGVPDSPDDVGAPVQMATLLAAKGVSVGMNTAALGLKTTANSLDMANESLQMVQDARMANLQDENDLSTMVTEAELANLKAEARLIKQKSANEVARLKEIIELSQAYLNAELTHERDLDEFRQRRLDFRQDLTHIAGLDLRVQQARLQFDQAVSRYLRFVQRAKLLDAKLRDLERQRQDVNALVGSPEVIFGRANRLDQAEARLNRAKDKLMEWLVALEYYAVRPFMDQRVAILLARNTYQLEKIAEELARLQRSCGGPINEVSSDLSVRDDLLSLHSATVDPVTEQISSPAQRFRAVLGDGYVPIDKRVRYSTDDTIGSLMSRDPDILAATFFIDLNDFANLELTCNAKVASLGVKLVGEVGDARPTVSVLYDGTSKLRSCQPGIDDYVAQFGTGATNYGKISHLRTVGRSMSPVAGVNEFVDTNAEGSQTFGGLPLASQYTILINKKAGENSRLDWDKLEDIELRLTYAYQDVFPEGQCE
ncbi:hypothetical protein FIV42_14065 [Persicimonas caeni]|uniref:Uncharacterized protein n=1 Tax=Persicimonas caeni TaxID=2292766 RepID=A0A4Y6PU30_PERCE|nr:dickkopf-related protein [Persicimonas caeni]QDG51826.1 hypothetical protein FIV42_14065 [Persicimonas caeni]QED33047.1 hypothetical protein FRD00_14060 [Persicimonas caeni]